MDQKRKITVGENVDSGQSKGAIGGRAQKIEIDFSVKRKRTFKKVDGN